MKTKELKKFFEGNGFNVFLYEQDKKQCAEIEAWTEGGVDMIINLMPFTIIEFLNYVNSFDVDEEIILHRQDKTYCDHFRISKSVTDFTDFHVQLKEVAAKLHK